MILTSIEYQPVTSEEGWKELVSEIRQQLQFQKFEFETYYALSNAYKVPLHLIYIIIQGILKNDVVKFADLASVSFYAICRDILIPYKNKSFIMRKFYNINYPYLKNTDKRLEWFLKHENGLTLTQKVSLLEEETDFNSMGIGKKRFQDAVFRLNPNATHDRVEELRLSEFDGMWSGAIASFIKKERGDLTAAEILITGSYLAQDTKTTIKMAVFSYLLTRMGKIEVFFLASQVNKFHDHVSRTSSLLRSFSNVFDIEYKTIERLVSMHSMVDVARLIEEEKILEEFEKLVPFRAFRPMLASKWAKKTTFPTFAEAKYDGVRLILHKLGNKLSCYSRRRKNYMYKFNAVAELTPIIPAFSIIIDGEITALHYTEHGPKYLNVYELNDAIRHGFTNYRLIYVVFDILYLNGQELVGIPYHRRKELRTAIVKEMNKHKSQTVIEIREVETVTIRSQKHLINVYNQFVNAGFEGAVIKTPDSTYELGKRSKKWMKLKPKETLDVTLTGVVPIQAPTGVRVWGFRYAVKRGDEFVNLGMIRGLDAATGNRLAELIVERGVIKPSPELVNLSEAISRRSRFTQSKETIGFELEPDIVVTIDSLGIVRKEGRFNLRNARFLHIREDKPVDEISDYDEIYRTYMV